MRNVIVTGGSSGIGKATAKKFLMAGDCVVVADVNPQNLEKTKKEFEALQGKAFYKTVDVSDQYSVAELIDFAKQQCDSIDVLVNCAGVFRGGLLHESIEDDFDFQFNVNVKGIYFMMKAVIPTMLSQQSGAVVNIASASGMGGDYNMPLYCASKAAVINLTRSTALDYASEGIRINCVSPAATATPMFLSGTTDAVMNSFLAALPDHKLGQPEQVADAIVFLASEQAAHICGHNIPVDGGLAAWNGQPKQDKELE